MQLAQWTFTLYPEAAEASSDSGIRHGPQLGSELQFSDALSAYPGASLVQ